MAQGKRRSSPLRLGLSMSVRYPISLLYASLSYLAWSIANNLVQPYLPLVATRLGASAVQVGYIGSAGLVGAALMVFPLSQIADRFGRFVALNTAWVISVFGGFLIAVAANITTLMLGVFLSMAVVASLPILTLVAVQQLSGDKRVRGMAIFYLGNPLGILVGSYLGGILSNWIGFREVRMLSAICLTVSLITLWFLRSLVPEHGLLTRVHATKPSRSLIVLALLASGLSLLLALPTHFDLLYLSEVHHMSLAVLAVFSALIGASQFLWSFLFTRWPNRAGEVRLRLYTFEWVFERVTVVSILTILVANTLYGYLMTTSSPWVEGLAILLRGSRYSLQFLGSAVFVGLAQSERLSVTYWTSLSAIVAVGMAVAPILGGLLYNIFPALPFWVCGFGCFLGVIVTVFFMRIPVVESIGQQGSDRFG